MKRKVINLYWGVPLAILVALAQSAVMPYLRLAGATPNLPLLFALSWVLLEGLGDGLVVSLIAGLSVDALSGGLFGLNLLSLGLTSVLAGVAEANVFRSARFLPYIMVCLATPVYHGVYLGLSALLRGDQPPVSLIWRLVLPATVINLVFMPLVYYLLKWLCARSRPRQVEWQ